MTVPDSENESGEIGREERGERELESREYTYTYIRTRTKRKLTLYVPENSRLLVDNARGVLKREGKTISNFLLEQLESYYRLHEPGNPQQRLDTILKIGKAYHAPSKICEVRDCFKDVEMIMLWHDFKGKDKREVGMCKKHGLTYSHEFPDVWKVLK